MTWIVSHKADPAARAIADRHYNRQHVGAPQFVPPGRALVLLSRVGRAFWITSWPFAEYVRHRWAGAWVCSAFRNEGAGLSSELIREALAASRAHFGGRPIISTPRGPVTMVTFVDASKVRHKRDPGRCYLRAGFERDGETKGGLLAFVLRPENCPEPVAPLTQQLDFTERFAS